MADPAQLTIVGVGDCRVENGAERSLITYALGSCIAVAIYDPKAKVGGMLHLMLPDSSLSPGKAEEYPYRFADTGLPLLFRSAYRAGADKRRLMVYVAGAAQVMADNGFFNIGKRNHLAVKKLLWRAGVMIHGEAVGGTESRTVRLELASGRFFIRTAAGSERLLEAKYHGAISSNC